MNSSLDHKLPYAKRIHRSAKHAQGPFRLISAQEISSSYRIYQQDMLERIQHMYLQGNLQIVFDALFAIGAIDPILKMDWQKVNAEIEKEPQRLHTVCESMNSCSDDLARMVEILKITDEKSINFLALEVAREFSEFQDRETLH